MDQLAFQIEYSPPELSQLVIKAEHSFGFLSDINPFSNMNLELGIGRHFDVAQKIAVSGFLSYGTTVGSKPEDYDDYLVLSGNGLIDFYKDSPYYLMIEYKLYLTNHRQFSKDIYKNIRIGIGINLEKF